MDGGIFWLAVGLALILESLFPLLAPRTWRIFFGRLLQMRDGQIRFYAICGIGAGLLLLWLAS